jgi:cytochrome c553
MMRDRVAFWSVLSIAALTVIAVLVGFVWLPGSQADFSARGVWDMICRAAGVPAEWSRAELARTALPTTRVVLLPEMGRAGSAEAVGRGASIALAQCTMCHGARGVSSGDTPNLAGQYPDVVLKQLADYQRGDRRHALMQSLAANLGQRDMADLAAYYASLPRERNVPVTDMSIVPPLVSVGDPMRNVAPCASCHGGIDRKLGAPWLEGLPKAYLVAQLAAFASGERPRRARADAQHGAGAQARGDRSGLGFLRAARWRGPLAPAITRAGSGRAVTSLVVGRALGFAARRGRRRRHGRRRGAFGPLLGHGWRSLRGGVVRGGFESALRLGSHLVALLDIGYGSRRQGYDARADRLDPMRLDMIQRQRSAGDRRLQGNLRSFPRKQQDHRKRRRAGRDGNALHRRCAVG